MTGQRVNPAAQERIDTGRHGEVVDVDLLLEIIQPELDRLGKGAFCRQCGITPRQLLAITKHEYVLRAHMAERILIGGMGRPDLFNLVCPDVTA